MKRLNMLLAAFLAAATLLTCSAGAWTYSADFGGAEEDPLPKSFDLRNVDGIDYTAAVSFAGSYGYPTFQASFGSAFQSLLMRKYSRRYEFSEDAMLDELFYGDDASAETNLFDGTPLMIASRYLDKGPATEYGYDTSGELTSGTRLTKVEVLGNESTLVGLNAKTGTIDYIKRALLDGKAVYCTSDNFYSFSDDSTKTGKYLYLSTSQDLTIYGNTVQIIGWNDTIPSEYFVNDEYYNPLFPDGGWLVQSCFGPDYASGGTYYTNYAGSTTYDQTVILSDAEIGYSFDTSYSHDPLGFDTFLGYENNNYVTYAANVFERENSNTAETLTEVTIATSGVTNYEIYVNPTSGDPAGADVKVSEGKIDYMGYTNVKLDESVALTGDKFAVVVRYETPGSSRGVPVESRLTDNYNANYSSATASRGESFLSRDGETWTDVGTREYDYTNCSIKAFTVGDHTGEALVSFDATPTSSRVYVSDGENDIEPRADGSYYLAEGDYTYTATTTDGESSGEFTVTSADVESGAKTIRLTLATAPYINCGDLENYQSDLFVPVSLGTGSLRASGVASVKFGGKTLSAGTDYMLLRGRTLLVSRDRLKSFMPTEGDMKTYTLTVTFGDAERTTESINVTLVRDGLYAIEKTDEEEVG